MTAQRDQDSSPLIFMGGAGVGLWETTDGGEHWTQTQRPPGLPPELAADGSTVAAVTDDAGVWVMRADHAWTLVPA